MEIQMKTMMSTHRYPHGFFDLDNVNKNRLRDGPERYENFASSVIFFVNHRE